MKIPVEIRSDRFFTAQVKSLILQKINEILHGEKNIKIYILELVQKFAERKEKKDFEAIIEKMIKKEVFTEDWSWNQKDFKTFVKRTIENTVKTEVKKYIEDSLFKEIKVVLKDKNDKN